MAELSARFQKALQNPVNAGTVFNAPRPASVTVSNAPISARFNAALDKEVNAGTAAQYSQLKPSLPVDNRTGLPITTQQPTTGFTVNTPATVPSAVLSTNTTKTDLLNQRNQMEGASVQNQANQSALSSFLQPGGKATDIDSFVNSLIFSPQETASEKTQNTLSSSISSALDGLLGRGKATIDAKEKAGIPALEKQKAELAVHVAKLMGDFQKSSALVENTPGITVGNAEARLNPMRRQQAADLGALSALDAALTGNIALAEARVKDTIDLQYGDTEQQIKNDMTRLQLLQPKLDKEQKQEAQKVQFALQLRQEEINNKKEEQKDIYAYAIEALQNGAPLSNVNQAIKSGSRETALGLVGSYIGSLDRRLKNAQIAKITAEAAKARAEAAAGVPVSGEFGQLINSVGGMVPATSRTAVTSGIANAIANKDYKVAYAGIANAVENGLTGTTKTTFADARTDVGVMSGMRDAIKSYTDAGGNLNILKGTADDIAKKFGQLATDPKFAALGVQLTREFQAYRNHMTGAAFTPEESGDYAKVNPRTNASLDLNLATIDGAIAQLENRITATINARVPDAQKIWDLSKGIATQPASDGLSIDEAYQEYLKMAQPASASGALSPTPSVKAGSTSMLPNLGSGYHPISLGGFLK